MEDVMSIPLPAIALPLPSSSVRLLTDCLHDLHARRLRELREILEPAREPDAGVWRRWSALRVIKHHLADWFEPERSALDEAGSHIPGGQAAHLWTEAELVAMLGWQLEHIPSLCHQPGEFARITLKLETVLEHWCREIEEAFGLLTWKDLSDEQGHALAVCAGEEPHHVT
jgi:hypothetical protein